LRQSKLLKSAQDIRKEVNMRKRTSAIILFFTVFCVVILSGCFQAAQEPTFDLIIKDGLVYDGTTDKPRVTDIGIKGDKISAIGKFSCQATKIIDARGFIVTPGFIDVHSRTDFILKGKGIWRFMAYIKPAINGNHNYLYQGVTSIITGNDGNGYTNTAKWLNWVDSLKFGVNVYHLAPVGAICDELFSGKEPQPLDENQRHTLKKRVLKEMENGAIGLSFDLSRNPDQLLDKEALTDIAGSINHYGGVVSMILRNSTGALDSAGNPAFVNSLKEVTEISRRAQTPLEISCLRLKTPWKNLNYEQISSIIRDARQAGIDVTADQTPYDYGFDILTSFLPPEYVANYEIKKEYTTAEGKNTVIKAVNRLFTTTAPENFSIISYPANKSYEGKNIRQIATFERKSTAQCYWEMASNGSPPIVAVPDSSGHFAKLVMRSPIVFTASEGISYVKDSAIPHPSYWGAFARKIRKYALEDKIVNLNDAIRSMTALPAEKFKLAGRGKITVGSFADIAIINIDTFRDKASFLHPEQYAEGVEYLIVNGILSIDRGKITGKKGGKALKRI